MGGDGAGGSSGGGGTEEEEAPARVNARQNTTAARTHARTEEEARTEKCAALTHTFSSRFPPQSPARSHPPPKVPAAKKWPRAVQKKQNWTKGYGRDCSGLDSTALDWTALLRKKRRQRVARVRGVCTGNLDLDSCQWTLLGTLYVIDRDWNAIRPRRSSGGPSHRSKASVDAVLRWY